MLRMIVVSIDVKIRFICEKYWCNLCLNIKIINTFYIVLFTKKYLIRTL